jgi:ribonucleoside-diphosphate reductase beta chain
MSILTPRVTYGPFEYPQFYDMWLKQQASFWMFTEVQMSSDINDFKLNLTESERNVIGNTLKGFVQTEIFVEDYWSSKVSRWFKKPEIQMMSSAFASFESIHATAYSYLEESLGIQNYESFLHEPTSKAKIDRLINVKGKSKDDIARSLAIFSAFNEGVNLFSSFSILLSFSRRNLLKGVGKIIEWSIRDESLHSKAGCMLFKILVTEHPEIFTDELKKDIYDAARLTVQLEDAFIDKAFELGPIEGLDPKDLKNYIRYRANSKLQELGLKSNWKNIDKESLERLSWFDVLSNGVTLQDFFASRETAYAKSIVDFEDIWNGAQNG